MPNPQNQIQPVKTDDGSDSLYLPHLDEHYHSTKGAIQESEHIFINAGLSFIEKDTISILEIGMGTGLNVLLTMLTSTSRNVKVEYTTLEKYPLPYEIYSKLNYPERLGKQSIEFFNYIHNAQWNTPIEIVPNFILHKIEADLLTWKLQTKFDLVYFDAFGPDKQPEMWQSETFEKIFDALNNNGVLVTYSAKGDVRRGLQNVGFTVTKLQGPPGKKHITRAVKLRK